MECIEGVVCDPGCGRPLHRKTDMRFGKVTNSLLKHKGGEVWSVGPDQSVYEAIQKWQPRMGEGSW